MENSNQYGQEQKLHNGLANGRVSTYMKKMEISIVLFYKAFIFVPQNIWK